MDNYETLCHQKTDVTSIFSDLQWLFWNDVEFRNIPNGTQLTTEHRPTWMIRVGFIAQLGFSEFRSRPKIKEENGCFNSNAWSVSTLFYWVFQLLQQLSSAWPPPWDGYPAMVWLTGAMSAMFLHRFTQHCSCNSYVCWLLLRKNVAAQMVLEHPTTLFLVAVHTKSPIPQLVGVLTLFDTLKKQEVNLVSSFLI